MSDNIKVVVKVRPLISREIEEKLSYQWRVKSNTLYQLDQNGKEQGQAFTFDKVYDKDTKTSDVYNDIAKPIVEAATAGFNGTIFAYGQTSSGKTYTMTGTDDSPGIIPLAVLNLFEIIKNAPDRDFLVRVSYMEIYNETVKDLLNPEKENIKVHETLHGIKVDVSEKVTSSPEEVLEAMKEGEANRQKGATNMNEQSSRSHSIFQITIESREHLEGAEAGCVNVSQLNLVDLAGSERAGQTGATGIRFKEGTHINKSLSSLALVIKQLSEDPNKFANYRDSKLTRILQNSLGGNAKTSIICAVTPAAVEETISTLQFANRAKAIKNKPEVNAVATDATMIQSLTKQMSKLQSQLENKKNVEQDNVKLQKQIASLQRLILNGFVQRRTGELLPAGRRKLVPPRRVTISAFHSMETEEEPVASVPKFCTPSLKYNPNLIVKPVDFVPVQNSSKLASVPEEPASRLITPPPGERRVNFNDEVIEIDSDDDSTQGETETCSPYHTCQGASKTPPCILRKNAKRAEKTLKDILELTEREKIYTPSVVELLEKLERNTAVITRLQDEVATLRKETQDKDSKVNQLTDKIKKTEEEMKAVASAKMELQTKCESYDAKLIDCEVSYDTLKNKAKLREEELLSLLEEFKIRKAENICKQLPRTIDKDIPFMDMSKDISLVNSDNESTVNVEPSEQMCDLVTDTQTQSNLKNQTIIELEANLFSHKQKIASLENLSQELQDTINSYKEKLTNIENENTLLKSTIDNLNSTINNQQENLEQARNDIASYSNVIQELQIKVTQREHIPNINLNDSLLDNMIANEEKFIANNENMKNIIQSLRNGLDSRIKEINELKSKLESNNNSDSKNLLEQLDSKTNQIDTLNIEVNNLNKQVKENIATINKLMHENTNMKLLEQELTSKLLNVEEKCCEIEMINKEHLNIINNLTRENEKLTQDITIATKAKDDLLSSLNEDDKESKENVQIAKTTIHKLQGILSTLTGEMQEVPEVIDNFVNVFSIFSDNLNNLEAVAADIVEQKDQAVKIGSDLKKSLEQLIENHNLEISTLQDQIDELNKHKSDYTFQKDELTLQISQLKETHEKGIQEMQTKLSEYETLQKNLNQINKDYKKLKEEIIVKNNIISDLNAKEKELNATLNCRQNSYDQELRSKQDTIITLTSRLKDIENALKGKSAELEVIATRLEDVQKGRDELLTNILKKASDLTVTFNIENTLSCAFDDGYVNIYERILLTLDKISNHITFIDMKNVECEKEDVTAILSEAKNEIKALCEQNLKLSDDVLNAENKNSELLFELEKIQSDNKSLNEDLVNSEEILQTVKKELKMKASEILSMEDKVKEWKDQFLSLDVIMKQQMHELHIENEYLKGQCCDIQTDSENVQDDINHDMKNKEQLSIPNQSAGLVSPPSLLTICCNKIIDSIQSSDSDSKTTASSSDTIIEVPNDVAQTNCRCKQLTVELNNARKENSTIMTMLEELEVLNQHLIVEKEEAREEIKSLIELQQELQKKLVSHRTNLSILTATTYAENKSLKSQVKVLQHHHNRFHNVCQRDIPDFKNQLRDLMSLLNGYASMTDIQNTSFKRYSLPDVLDSSTAAPNFKNESTLDGDLLMLDTNITLTTAADNTLLGPDHTCLDITQAFYNEASCQTNDMVKAFDQNVQTQMEILSQDNQSMFEKLKLMRDENLKLREQVDKYLELKESMTDSQNSPIKIQNLSNDNCIAININNSNKCSECSNRADSYRIQEKLEHELKLLSEELLEVKAQKSEIELKFNNLVLETPSTDALVKKLCILEKDHTSKEQEITKLNKTLESKTKLLKSLQEENDSLSTQVMENISEADDLNKELESLRQKNTELTDRCNELEQSATDLKSNIEKQGNIKCSECLTKEELLQSLQLKLTKTKLNRSLSDSDTSSRYNKICTLQSELHAGREDCIELTEDVATIKNHLERSDLSMDLDESMGDSSVFTFAKDFRTASPQSNKCNMPDIPEEHHLDMYMMDKIDCFTYYSEKTGTEIKQLNRDVKIIEVMKMLYEKLTISHGTEIEHLSNSLKEYSEAKVQLQKQIENINTEYLKLTKEFEEYKNSYSAIACVLPQIKNNTHLISQEIMNATDTDKINATDTDKITRIVNIYKEKFLQLIDKGLGLSSVSIFESLISNIVNKYQTDVTDIMEQYTKVRSHMENVTTELNLVNENLAQMKCQLSDKEDQYNLLKAQKERIHEISNAVTLDIVKREKELNDTMTKGYQRLLELNILTPNKVDLTLPLNMNINLLFDQLITQNENRVSPEIVKETEKLRTEISELKLKLEAKEKEEATIKTTNEKLQEINKRVIHDIIEKENKIQTIKKIHEELSQVYESKVDENKSNIELIQNMVKEIDLLKNKIKDKEEATKALERELHSQKEKVERDDNILELLETIKDENANLKSVNQMINKEKETYALELQKSGDTIRQNNIELDRMTSDILVLRESVKDNISVIENLKVEAKTLLKENIELKDQLEDKCRECSRLETNIRTHEKTAEIQTRIINRLEKQKNEVDIALIQKNKELEELSQKCALLQKECDSIKECRDENDSLKKLKESLEARILELQAAVDSHKPRSLDVTADASRRRRQSLHDSKRLSAEHDDHNHVESGFGSRPKPDDIFMDVDDDFSNRSTPIRLSKGRESLSVSRTDQSEKDEEHSSRPSSVLATRRRRQSIHDLYRSVQRNTPSPHDFQPSHLMEKLNNLKASEMSNNSSNDSEVSQLKQQLLSCQQELEDLKEKYRELDEECETCAEYLRERDDQCNRLRKEKTVLQSKIAELEEKIQSSNLSQQVAAKRSMVHAAVNTDEDWANLHSVVVDRMSYDAEVEKNKKLTKTIEELRFTKQDLKNTLAKMQKALEKGTANKELEATKLELEACREELQELRERYKELDEECETCAEYLRDKEEQCRKLREAKLALESKLREFQDDVSSVTHSSRKKRRSLHDQNRASAVQVSDAATETTDFLSYQVERDSSSRVTDEKYAKETKRLKMMVEKLSQQKASLEQQLLAGSAHAPPAVYVATGSAIVQNQQLTDVMKENQKLKKINAKLINICKKRGKESNRENEDPAEQG